MSAFLLHNAYERINGTRTDSERRKALKLWLGSAKNRPSPAAEKYLALDLAWTEERLGHIAAAIRTLRELRKRLGKSGGLTAVISSEIRRLQ